MSTQQQNDDLALMAEVFTKIPAAILIIDDHGIITHANDSALKLMGSKSLTGQHWVKVISQVFRPRNDDGLQISTRDGRRLQVATIPLAHGQLVQMTDLTETRLLQEKLSHMERLSSLGRMAASLAHQIRTPLSAALLYASNLANDDLAPEMRLRFQQKLMSRLESLEAQISDILMFARSNEKTVSEMDATELISPVVNNVTALLERSQAHLLTVYDPAVKLPILGNPVALNSALCNLIVNAIEAGAKQIVLKVDREGERVVFSVANDGPTIPEELKSKIFEPFFTSKSSGTGLGLAVVSAVTKVHQGLLTLTAWPEPFTTVFTISIPRYQAQTTVPPAPVSAAVKAVVQAQNEQLLVTAAAGALSVTHSSGVSAAQSTEPLVAAKDRLSTVPSTAEGAESRGERTYNSDAVADAVKLGRSAPDPATLPPLEIASNPSKDVAPLSLNEYLASYQNQDQNSGAKTDQEKTALPHTASAPAASSVAEPSSAASSTADELTLEHFLAATKEQRAQAQAAAPYTPDMSAPLMSNAPQTTARRGSDLTFVPQSMRQLPPTAEQVSKQEAISANQATLQAFAHYAQSHQQGGTALRETPVASEEEQELLRSMSLRSDAHRAENSRMADKQRGSGGKDKVSPHHRTVRKAQAKNQSSAQAYETVASEQFGFREVDIEIKPPKASTRSRSKAHGTQRS